MKLMIAVALISCLSGCAEARSLTFEDIFLEEKRIVLDSRDEFLIGPLPRIGAVTADGDIIILDITPRVGIYDKIGSWQGENRRTGRWPGRVPLSRLDSLPQRRTVPVRQHDVPNIPL